MSCFLPHYIGLSATVEVERVLDFALNAVLATEHSLDSAQAFPCADLFGLAVAAVAAAVAALVASSALTTEESTPDYSLILQQENVATSCSLVLEFLTNHSQTITVVLFAVAPVFLKI